MTPDPDVLDEMRRDWNQRAREDAHYYVAFGRRGQDDQEFFATSADLIRSMQAELRRLPSASRTALEIGCGPGRLMRPASQFFTEIHGVDVSDEMVRLAAENLRDIPHARVHATSGADLALFHDDVFDFVYSYAVFQHIPSREVVFQYLAEARRVLKPGGILWCQINGLPEQARRYSTWDGVRLSAEEIAAFARGHDLQLLKLEGVSTQYMWITCRKQESGWGSWLRSVPWASTARLRNISNARTGEPAVPASGPLAAASLWIERLPADCDLNHLDVRIDGSPGRVSYVGPPQWDGITQVNVALPEDVRTGLVPVEVWWLGKLLSPEAWMRIVPAGPLVPRLCALSDGINLLSGARIVTGSVKITLEEVASTELFEATVDGEPVRDPDFFCTDPLARRFEVNFRLPEKLAPGAHQVRVRLGRRAFPPVTIEVG